MAMGLRRSQRTTVTETKPSMMARLTNGRAGHMKTKTTTTSDVNPSRGRTAVRTGRSGGLFKKQQHAHHKRHATMGDKISGALTKMKGDIEGRPGVKAAGTRRMHGTDGRGSHRVY